MARFLFLIVLATLLKNSLQQGCQTVRISGSTQYQTSRMTTYTMTGGTHDGRSVYQSSRGDYLYYSSSDTTWNVGPTLGSTSVGMHVTDTSTYADSIFGLWYLYDGVSTFQADSAVSVTGTCSTSVDSLGLSIGAIVGIVVGVFVGVVLLIIVLCCCCVCAASKKGGSTATAVQPAPTPMYSTPGGYPPPPAYPLTTAYPPPPAYPRPPPEPEPERSVVIIGLVVPASRD